MSILENGQDYFLTSPQITGTSEPLRFGWQGGSEGMQVFNFALAQNFNSEHKKGRGNIVSVFGAWVVARNFILLLETKSSPKSPHSSGVDRKLLS